MWRIQTISKRYKVTDDRYKMKYMIYLIQNRLSSYKVNINIVLVWVNSLTPGRCDRNFR